MARIITAGSTGGADNGGGLQFTNEVISATTNTDIVLDPLGTGVVRVDGDLRLTNQGVVRFGDADNSNFVALRSGASVSSNVTWTLPTTDASAANQAIVSDAAGTLSFATVQSVLASNTSDSADNYVVFNSAQTGVMSTPRSSTALLFKPSTGTLSATAAVFSGTVNSLRTENTYSTSMTLALGDRDKVVTMTNSSDATVTVPPNSSVAFPVGSIVHVVRTAAGKVTLVAGAGVTLSKTGTFAAGEEITLRKRLTDTWSVIQSPTPLIATSNTPAVAAGYNVHTYTSGANFVV